MQGKFTLSPSMPSAVERFLITTGWITSFAWICSCTSNPALISNIIMGLAIFNYPNYVPSRWHSTLLMWGTTTIKMAIAQCLTLKGHL